MQRSLFIDSVKGVAVLLVVLGHSIQYGSGQSYLSDQLFYDSFLFKAIYSFHMPLFMAISGYLYSRTIARKTSLTIFMSRTKTLVLPIASFSIIKLIVQSFGIGEFEVDFAQCFNIFLDNLWFLWSLWICSMICLLIEHFHIHWSIYLLIISCSILAPNFHNLPYASFLFPSFVIGLKTGQYRWEHLLFDKRVGLVSCAVFILLLLLYDKDSYIYTSGTCVFVGSFFNQLYIDVYRWIIGTVGCVAILFVLRSIMPEGAPLLAFIGMVSLGVYCWQDTFIRVLLHVTRNCASPNILWWAVSFFILLICPLSITIITQRIPILRIVLYGRSGGVQQGAAQFH